MSDEATGEMRNLVEEKQNQEVWDAIKELKDAGVPGKLLEVISWAQATVELYGYASDYQDPLHQLACALRELVRLGGDK